MIKQRKKIHARDFTEWGWIEKGSRVVGSRERGSRWRGSIEKEVRENVSSKIWGWQSLEKKELMNIKENRMNI